METKDPFSMEVRDSSFEKVLVPDDVYDIVVSDVRGISKPDKSWVIIDCKIERGTKLGWESYADKVIGALASPKLGSNVNRPSKLYVWCSKLGFAPHLGAKVTLDDLKKNLMGKKGKVLTQTLVRPNGNSSLVKEFL